MLTEEFHWRGRTVLWGRTGNGPAVVMCHGTPWSSVLWEPYAQALSRDHTVYLWDMPGYGRSSMDPEHAVDLGVQGELLADLLRHWQLERPHVVAHDIGGAVSLRAHLMHGASYASLALVDVVALRPWGSAFFRLVAQNTSAFLSMPGSVHRGALEAYIEGASHRGLTARERTLLTDPWLGHQGQGAFYRQIAQADETHTDEIEPRYGEIAIPVSIIWGREDTWIPADRAERLGTLIPGADVDVIDGAGHLIQLDAPVALTALLVRWLAARRR